MDGDVLKALLLLAVTGGLYFLTRSRSETRVHLAPPPVEALGLADIRPRGAQPVVGAEIPFPFDVKELEADFGHGFFRPLVRNYYFRHTDLLEGPPAPEDFYDEFFIELEHPENGYRWTTSFHVGTPAGLARLMQEERTQFLFGDGAIVVQRYDLKTILRAVLTHFAEPNDPLLRAQEEQRAKLGKPPLDAE